MTTKPLSTAAATGVADTTSSNALNLKPWKEPVVTCNGDYREEAWLEQHVGGPLYSYQQQLPRLPVNPIQDTLSRFLPTALPLAENASEEQALLEAVQNFETAAAPLQQRLEQRAEEFHDSSWLQHWYV